MQQPIATNDVNLFSTFKENQYFDRKSARKDDKEIAKHISAFANAAGGKLVIGIEDDGEVTGFKRSGARDIENFERAALTTCTPTPIVRKDVVGAAHGWWYPEESGEEPHLYGVWKSNVNSLIPHRVLGKMGFGAPYKQVPVKVCKTPVEECVL